MYIDESGDHGLKTVDPRYPVFVLGGVIVDRTCVRTDIRSRVQQLKRDFFGRDDIVLHTADIVRGRNGFERLAEPGFRTEFYTALNVMMDELEYTVGLRDQESLVHRRLRGRGARSVPFQRGRPPRRGIDLRRDAQSPT